MKIKTVIIVFTFTAILASCKKENNTKNVSPKLVADTTSISFGTIGTIGNVVKKNFILSAAGNEVISWQATANSNWFHLSQSLGEVLSMKDTITVSINTSTLTYGNYEGEIIITPFIKNVVQTPITIKVTANINVQTIIGYALTKDETWSGNILLTGDIVIPSGFSLTINPGTKIMVAYQDLSFDGGALPNGVDFDVKGNLYLKGTANNPVQILSNYDTSAREVWKGIFLNGHLEMTYCAISNSHYGIFIFSSVTNAPLIKHCQFSTITTSMVDFSAVETSFSNNSFINVQEGYSLFVSNKHASIDSSLFNNNTLTDVSISGVISNIISNASINVTNSNFSNNHWNNLMLTGYGYVTNSKITATNCYGINTYSTNEYGNTIILQNQLLTPNQKVGCGFTLSITSQSMKAEHILSPNALQTENEKALILNQKHKIQ